MKFVGIDKRTYSTAYRVVQEINVHILCFFKITVFQAVHEKHLFVKQDLDSGKQASESKARLCEEV